MSDPSPTTRSIPFGLIVQAENHLVDLRQLLEELDLVMDKRAIEDRHDRFRRIEGEWPETRTKPSSQEDGLHGQRS